MWNVYMKREIKKHINKDSKETFVAQLKPVIKTMAGDKIGEVVSFAIDEILIGGKGVLVAREMID